MPRFTRADLESFRNKEVPDLLGPTVRLLFVGVNPGLWTAATSTHFAHPGNRFYPALYRGGVVDRIIDPAGTELWVVPNPSGLNTHDTIDSLAAAYADAATAAGVVGRTI